MDPERLISWLSRSNLTRRTVDRMGFEPTTSAVRVRRSSG
jgi:hypothetical protein